MGTSSQRRRAQLKALRPDIEAVEFRGNVDTRLRKLAEGQVDAILLAAAGLDRLGKTDWVRERLDPKDFCPAAGQGALGIETRKDDAATIEAVAFSTMPTRASPSPPNAPLWPHSAAVARFPSASIAGRRLLRTSPPVAHGTRSLASSPRRKPAG